MLGWDYTGVWFFVICVEVTQVSEAVELLPDGQLNGLRHFFFLDIFLLCGL